LPELKIAAIIGDIAALDAAAAAKRVKQKIERPRQRRAVVWLGH
jgi:hypothetical protein